MDLAWALDTFFALFAFTLIILMVPGFAMLEAGLVRTKNVTAVLTVNTMIYLVASLVFFLWGYVLAFGGWDGSSMSMYAAFLFQLAFVGKTVNIMSGGVSERTRIIPLAIFTIFMAGLIYPLVVNWTWGANMLKGTFLDISAMHDLAGSTVIHSTGAWALLAAILIIGPRKGRYTKDGKVRVIPASNIPLVVLGAFLLWIGWFGFNGGSVGSISSKEAANTVALVVMNTNNAGLIGGLAVMVLSYLTYKKFDITMILNGALGGLVAITAGADVVSPYAALLIGLIGGILVFYAVPFFDKLRLDDPVGALSVHLVNGIWGTIATGIWGKGVSLAAQIKGVVVVGIFAFVASYIIIWAINKIVPFRANEEDEIEGLDVSECGIESYPEFKRAI
ncbi:ammonium transporter [Caminibacter pacificus]|uniref:Ammonium transporter n=1 Tax=Caminibacter pacificus TaxID=1424653 RepID=A0AAJ4UXG5_9BACT|nr:ammonium transporter [Caminibacter pacificus]QCI28851.1 ammonium transporter [Caminibacter pacificus]ROR39440.1 Amt family ammonium transporter [Caminibacter pacificus]